MSGKMLIALLLTMVFGLFLTGCGTSCSQSDDDDETADDDNDDSSSTPPPGVPDGAYQCEMKRLYEFEDGFCDDCCGDMWNNVDDDDYDESDEWRCNWFYDFSGHSWTTCGAALTFNDFGVKCYAELLRLCGHDNWRLPRLAEIQQLRAFNEDLQFFYPTHDWLWIDELASAYREKSVSEDDLPPQLACFNFQTGEIGCTEGERYELVAGALFVWP